MDDIRLLKTFLAVADAGSMSEAAATIGCTSPAISQQVARLETSLEVKLMERDNKGIILTPSGLVLAEHARQILGLVRNLKSAVAEVEQKPTDLRIIAFASAGAHLLPKAFIKFQSSFPKTRIHLEAGYDPNRPFDSLLTGDVDMVVAHEYDNVPLLVPNGIFITKLGNDPISIAFPKKHPLLKHRKLRLEMMRDENWILYPDDVIATISFKTACKTAGFEPRSNLSAPDYEIALGLVDAGFGISPLPQMVTSRAPSSIKMRGLAKHLGRSVLLAKRSGDSSRSIATMRSALQQAFLDLYD